MTQFLVKLFFNDYENTNNAIVRTSYGVMVSIVGVICNLILFGIKITIGLVINSISVMADAFNNLSDAGSSIVSFIGVKMAERPADKEHPYGHGRSEHISALIVAFIILQVGFSLLQSSFDKILHPQEVGFNWIIVMILCISILVKLWLSLFNKKIGNRINSTVMKATSADSLSDVMVTSATILSITVTKVTGINIDGWMGLAVSLLVMYAGFNIAKATLTPLLGGAIDREVYASVTSKVESYKGIIGCHDFITHNYGPSHTMATIHAEVPHDSNIEEVHETIDLIERDVLRDLGIYLVIHMDTVDVNDRKLLEKKSMVLKIVSSIEPKATVHDFRVINKESAFHLRFDLVIPHSYNKKDKDELIIKVTEDIYELYKCQSVINIESSYIEE